MLLPLVGLDLGRCLLVGSDQGPTYTAKANHRASDAAAPIFVSKPYTCCRFGSPRNVANADSSTPVATRLSDLSLVSGARRCTPADEMRVWARSSRRRLLNPPMIASALSEMRVRASSEIGRASCRERGEVTVGGGPVSVATDERD